MPRLPRLTNLTEHLRTWACPPPRRTPRGTGCAPSAVHLVAGSTTSPVLAQIARKRSLKTGSCSHAGSVFSYPVQKTRCGVLATRLGR